MDAAEVEAKAIAFTTKQRNQQLESFTVVTCVDQSVLKVESEDLDSDEKKRTDDKISQEYPSNQINSWALSWTLICVLSLIGGITGVVFGYVMKGTELSLESIISMILGSSGKYKGFLG